MAINRGTLRRMAAQGRLEMVESYHFDDMMGTSATKNATIPVIYPRPQDWHDRKEGILYLDNFDFTTKSGCCYESPNGTVTLIVHSNCNYTFRIKEKEGNYILHE